MRERKLNRKPGYDYSADGWYLFTQVTKDRIKWFGEIENNEMKLNQYGEILKNAWQDLPYHYDNCVLDEMVIMPDHMHGIIEINNSINVGTGFPYVETGLKPVSTGKIPAPTRKIHGLSEMIRALKTFSSRRINEISDSNFAWQRSSHDRIIRNETEYIRIKNYILNNPLNFVDPDLEINPRNRY